jgi:hypothetical protein
VAAVNISDLTDPWRKIIASAPTAEAKSMAFTGMCSDVAQHSVNGDVTKQQAVDAMNQMADRHGLLLIKAADEIQIIISDAILEAEAQPRFGFDDAGPAVSPSYIANGGGNGAAAAAYAKPTRPPPPIATPYRFPLTIPARGWLYAGHYVRGATTATVAPGGWGKTSLTVFELLTMALDGVRCWYISGEDPRVEIDRRIAAHAKHHKLTEQQRQTICNNLFVDDRKSFPLTIGKSPRAASVLFDEPWLRQFEQQIIDNRIDVVALDPFISFHSVPEGDNGAIDQIIKRLAGIAERCNCDIEISHHVRKQGQGMQNDLTVDDTRGGSAIINAVRSCRVLNRMAPNEAAIMKISNDARAAHLRIDRGKRNMAPAEHAKWFKLVSVPLDNGDNVQAVEYFEYKSAFADLTTEAIPWVQNLLRERPRRCSSQSTDWLGHDIGNYVGRDTTQKEGAIWANTIIGEWLRNKVFKTAPLRDPHTRKPNVPFYVHNEFAEPTDKTKPSV